MRNLEKETMLAMLNLILSAALAAGVGLVGLTGCATTPPKPPEPAAAEIGLDSYYADRFHGRQTANGERYDRQAV